MLTHTTARISRASLRSRARLGLTSLAAAFSLLTLAAAGHSQATLQTLSNGVYQSQATGSNNAGDTVSVTADQLTLLSAAPINPSNDRAGIDYRYLNAFDAWNSAQPSDGQWTIKNGGPLPAGSQFKVGIYQAATIISGPNGEKGGSGVNFIAQYVPGSGAPARTGSDTNNVASDIKNGAAGFVQAIESDVDSSGASVNGPYLDQFSSPDLAPLFGGVGPSGQVGDAPSRDSGHYWHGVLYLATFDYTNRVVTVYDGLSYGFHVDPVYN